MNERKEWTWVDWAGIGLFATGSFGAVLMLLAMSHSAPLAQSGGTGVPNDWATVREHRAQGAFEGLPPVIAAAGLTPQTVGRVVADVRPWAVDVSSGVERDRVKDPALVRAFISEVRRVDVDRG